jgi:hypothetical protein
MVDRLRGKSVARKWAVLADYRAGRLTLAQIGRKHQVDPTTVCHWARMEQLPHRRRGRPRRTSPTPRQLQIIALARVLSYREVGHRFGITRQAVFDILKRCGEPRKRSGNQEWSGSA